MSTIQLFAHSVDTTANLPWLVDAACGDLDLGQLDMFFVGIGHTLSAEAAVLCRSCPVSTECLQHAVDRRATAGYFGGLSPAQRHPSRMAPEVTSSKT